MYLHFSYYTQAREALTKKRSWSRPTSQTIDGAYSSVRLRVYGDGSWLLAKPTASFEDEVVRGETIEDFDRQVWTDPPISCC